ncbi:MAG TPA: hypothetical protein VNE63_12525, partial [Candidatus Acidoferrales bacterium]|nr:hypothetical protein [Candidatus Acidoferrales bacterium]
VNSTPGRGSRFVVRIPPTPLVAEQSAEKIGKRIFDRTNRDKHVPAPAAIQAPPPSRANSLAVPQISWQLA